MAPSLEITAKAFEAKNTGVDVRVELSASRLTCDKIADQDRVGDLVFSADYRLIDTLLIPAHADFNLLFASNALVLAYNADSPIAARLVAGEAWQRVLSESEVRVGIANPRAAPAGYRALLALRLNDRVASPELRVGSAIAARITARQQRPDVAKLLAPLQTGELDAAFIYLSEARQYNLPYVRLDDRIDFSRPEHQELYASATVDLPADGATPSQTVRGSAAVYGLTIPRIAARPELARRFLRFFFSAPGRALIARTDLALYSPAELRVNGKLPTSLMPLLEE